MKRLQAAGAAGTKAAAKAASWAAGHGKDGLFLAGVGLVVGGVGHFSAGAALVAAGVAAIAGAVLWHLGGGRQ